jgi:uncharacterized protein Yka (UPF0111/DUF47 family)
LVYSNKHFKNITKNIHLLKHLFQSVVNLRESSHNVHPFVITGSALDENGDETLNEFEDGEHKFLPLLRGDTIQSDNDHLADEMGNHSQLLFAAHEDKQLQDERFLI